MSSGEYGAQAGLLLCEASLLYQDDEDIPGCGSGVGGGYSLSGYHHRAGTHTGINIIHLLVRRIIKPAIV